MAPGHGESFMRLLIVVAGWLIIEVITAHSPCRADDFDRLKVGVQPDGRIVVPTNQVLKPAGRQVTFPGRPVDLVLADEGKSLVVKNMRGLVFIDVETARVKQTLDLGKEGPEPVLSIAELMKSPIGADGKPRRPTHATGFS